jgi:16S rRNA (cytidine1402-2'-O)-methyltransferase
MSRGKLYLVPTPIGNLEDITRRSLKVLQQVDIILAEDTRKTSFLLRHFQVEKKILSHHKFNEHRFLESIIGRLLAGETFALVTDAGTPGISDPGYLLTRACIEQGIELECLPGPTALIPALVNSGLPIDRFVFEGFLPVKKGRQQRLESLRTEERTMVFYESPFRLVKTLQQMSVVFGPERKASVARELTKIHEENIRGTLKELALHYSNKTVKGEIVLVVQGCIS